MNYLITTFDGFGDGVIYYPFFKEIGEKMSRSLFFYTSNMFFSDNDIQNKIQIPRNFRLINNRFRKFPRNYWDKINTFSKQNNIKIVINLRTTGRRYERDYYDFKDHLSKLSSGISFYDGETSTDNKKISINIRDIILNIIQQGTNRRFFHDSSVLRPLFPIVNDPDGILVNMHSRGLFKSWESAKWAELISSLISSNQRVVIYEGVNEHEKFYTKKVIKDLSPSTRSRAEILRSANLYELGKSLRNRFLLISIDSGLIHFADSIGINSLGIYMTTSPFMWGGITNKFHYVNSKHLFNCKNFYASFGMCMNNKQKCDEILNDRDDVSVEMVLEKVSQIYEKKD